MSQDTKLSPPPEDAPTIPSPATVRIGLPSTEEGARYREHGVLGRGGMGEVQLVEDGRIGRDVAVKTILASLADNRSLRARFLREARIQGQLEHPSIVPVYDLGVDESGNDYFTMKRIAGRTLASVLRALASGDETTVRAFPRNALLAVFRQVCLAIAYAHSRGVIHRDL